MIDDGMNTLTAELLGNLDVPEQVGIQRRIDGLVEPDDRDQGNQQPEGASRIRAIMRYRHRTIIGMIRAIGRGGGKRHFCKAYLLDISHARDAPHSLQIGPVA